MRQSCSNTYVCPAQQPEREDSLAPLVKRILLFANGSTTLLLQCIVGHSITVKVHDQMVVPRQDLPPSIAELFQHEEHFLYRISSLYTGQTLLSTNVVYTGISTLSETLQAQLSTGAVPLGNLIDHAETRRELLRAAERCFCEVQSLFKHFPILPLLYPVKEYKIIHQEKCWFYVCELFHLEQIAQEARLLNPRPQKFLEGVAER